MKRHAMDALSLVFGLFFLGVAMLYAWDFLGIQFLNFEWILAGALLALGAGLLLSSARRRDAEQ